MMPRATVPADVPMPQVDLRALEAVEAADRARAESARREPPPSDVRALGSALLDFNKAVTAGDDAAIHLARGGIDAALRPLYGRANAEDDLLALRASHLAGFLTEVERFERTGEQSEELIALGGPFIRRLGLVGWVTGHHVHFDAHALRVAFKTVWNSLTVGEDTKGKLMLALDEQRALYTFYFRDPHPGEVSLPGHLQELQEAKDERSCERARKSSLRDAELWRLEKIKKLGVIDPSYPTKYALGVGFYRAGRFDQSSQAFRSYVEAHPDGPYALRARNHLMAALRESAF